MPLSTVTRSVGRALRPRSPRSPGSARSRSRKRFGTRKSTAAKPQPRSARTTSALLVAPSASKSPMTSTRRGAVREQQLHGRRDPLERADRQQPLERGVQVLCRAHAARRVHPPQHRMQAVAKVAAAARRSRGARCAGSCEGRQRRAPTAPQAPAGSARASTHAHVVDDERQPLELAAAHRARRPADTSRSSSARSAPATSPCFRLLQRRKPPRSPPPPAPCRCRVFPASPCGCARAALPSRCHSPLEPGIPAEGCGRILSVMRPLGCTPCASPHPTATAR